MKTENFQGTPRYLGDFSIESDTAVVTDPCYALGTWCQAQISNVHRGTWKGYVYRLPDKFALKFKESDIARAKEEVKSKNQFIETLKELQEEKTFLKGLPEEKEKLLKMYETLTELSTFLNAEEKLKKLEQSDYSRVSVLLAHHESIDLFGTIDQFGTNVGDWELVEADIGVDSGQMSISGLEVWQSKETSLDYEGEETPNPECPSVPHRGSTGPYWDICDITCGNDLGGGIYNDKAVVSRSGYGDGSYEAFTLTHNGKICGIAIVFISDNSSEEEELK